MKFLFTGFWFGSFAKMWVEGKFTVLDDDAAFLMEIAVD